MSSRISHKPQGASYCCLHVMVWTYKIEIASVQKFVNIFQQQFVNCYRNMLKTFCNFTKIWIIEQNSNSMTIGQKFCNLIRVILTINGNKFNLRSLVKICHISMHKFNRKNIWSSFKVVHTYPGSAWLMFPVQNRCC